MRSWLRPWQWLTRRGWGRRGGPVSPPVDEAAQVFGPGWRGLLDLGARDGRANVPDAEMLNPWPTPTMRALQAEGRRHLVELRADSQEALELPRIRLAMARQRVAQAAKALAGPSAGSSESASAELVRELATAEAVEAAAEFRIAKVEEVYRQRLNHVRHATTGRLEAYWGANLAARDEEGRLLLSQLEIPPLADETEPGHEA